LRPVELVRLEIEKAECAWRSASLSNEVSDFEKLLADDFWFIMMGGYLTNRSEFLDSVRRQKRKIYSVSQAQVIIQTYFNTAIVIGSQIVDAEFFGNPFKGETLVSRTWIKIEGIWKLASFHASDTRLLSEWNKLRAQQ
jgi:hypothetical protein